MTGLVERLSKIPYTGAVSDILDEIGFHDQVLPHEIQPLHPGHVVVGRALTILGERTESEDPEVIFVPFLKMLGEVKPDDVLVNQPNDHLAAHLGELSTETAQYRGARGAVIDGGARDTDYILKLGFPALQNSGGYRRALEARCSQRPDRDRSRPHRGGRLHPGRS
jgi:4-hydroxy-4-methyl-2-oxoglutarate aldolase